MEINLTEMDSPVGELVLAVGAGRVCVLSFGNADQRVQRLLRARYGAAVRLREGSDPQGFAPRLRGYFEGDVRALDAIPVDTGGTAFQQRVWKALRRIRAGTTSSYGELAAAIGQPRAVRAVGMANARNPVALILPCHRVIGADGSLTGYGGGLERKRWLLEHEGVEIKR